MSGAEGEVTPRASHRASSPERTPGRSPEGHVAFLVQEAEDRSQRRAAAIRHVLESIRIAPPLPTGRRAESPADSEGEAALIDTSGDDQGGGVRSSQESTTLEELLPRVAPQAVTGPHPREMLEVWKTRCESLEKALETCRLEAQESLEASQAELAAVEGRVAKREAELRQEIIDLRSQHAKERERWRAEGKRLQSSLKETQRRTKAESEAKCAATEQVEVLRQQLARLDSKRSRDEKEAKHSEEMKQRHAEFLRWVASQCAAALGEAETGETNVSEDVTRQLLSRVIAQRGRQPEGEGRRPAEAKTERSETAETLHTEWRGRVRAAEQAQKKMQRLMQKEAEAQEAQRELQTEEMVELKLRVNTLQRAKEVSERFVEEEEESWLRSKAQLREAESEVLSAMASARHYEAEARCASGDAVRAQAKATGAEAARRRLQAEVESLQQEAQRSPPPLLADLGKIQQSWRDTAALEEVSEAQRQMGHWRNEAERSCAELTKLRASCEQLQLQSTEQAKVEEAKRRLMQQALKEQAQEMQREFDQALREVQDLRDKESFQLQEKAQELHDKEHTVSRLTSELEDLRSKQVESDSRLSKSADLLHSSEALTHVWQNEAQQQKEQLSEEIFELHQSYAKRLQQLRAQQGGEKRAFQVVEDELRQIYTEEVQVCRRNQEAWAEATEAAFSGEVAEARLARMAVEESESAAFRQENQVQEKLQEQLVMLKNHLGGEAPAGLHPASHELFKQLCVSIEAALCDEIRGNPCSELRRTLRRDLKQELRDQLQSEVHSVRRCREASTGSTTGSSARRVQASRESPPSAVRQELTRRGAALMEAFTAAAEMPQHMGQF